MTSTVMGFVKGNAVALLALFVALGGTSYAAVKLPKDSVTAVQIKAGAVRTGEVKNGSLLKKDFKAGQLPKGAPGPAGRSALTDLRVGETVRGFITGDYDAPASGADWRVGLSFPIPGSSVPIAVYVDGVTPGETCTGTGGEPTAPVGTLCVYLQGTTNPPIAANSHEVAEQSRFGFQLSWVTVSSGDTFVRGSYAYTQG